MSEAGKGVEWEGEDGDGMKNGAAVVLRIRQRDRAGK